MSRFSYFAKIQHRSEIRVVTSASLRKLAKDLDISVNTIRSLLTENRKCRTGRKISIKRYPILKEIEIMI